VTAAQPRALAGLTLCVALWGMVFVAVHELLPVMGPVQMVTLRFLLAAALFAALMAVRAEWRPRFTRREWLLCVAAGVLAVPGTQLAVVEGQRYLAPPIASLVVTTSPVVAAALGAAFLSERITRRNLLGFGVALAGVAMIVVLGAGTGADAGASDPLRASITVIGPVAWAMYTLLSKPVSDVHPAVPVVGVAVIAGTLSLAPAVPHALSGLGDLSAGAWGWMLYMVLGGTLAPYLLWSTSLKRLDVSRTASFMYLVPVFATTWSILLLGTTLTAATVLGGAVVLGGVVLTQRA
jgi:drug/metabolite transporter (DMT)-like permease